MSDSNNPLLIVIAGPNGSGKTTFTNDITTHSWGRDCLYINPDEIAKKEFGVFTKESHLKAAQIADKLRNDALANQQSIVFETVFSSQEKIEFIERDKAAGYFVRLFFISTSSPAINASRIANRVMTGGHSVDIEKIISRYSKSIANAIKIAQLVDRLYVIDNSEDGKMFSLLFRSSNGVLQKEYKDSPAWAADIKASLHAQELQPPKG